MGARFEQLPRRARAEADPALVLVARRLKATRDAIRGRIAPLLVQNPALDLLLALFIAEDEGRLLTEDEALGATGVAARSGQRWFSALLTSGLVEHVGEFVALSEDGRRGLMEGLDAALTAVRKLDSV